MTHKDELIERVAEVYWCVGVAQPSKWRAIAESDPITADLVRKVAALIVDAVRAYDAERRSSVLDVDALKTFNPTTPGTLVWLPDGMPSIPTHNPDDYRDLPLAMAGPVRFEGGLTEGK